MRARQKFFLELDWNFLKIFYGIVETNGVASAANVLWRKQFILCLALQRLEKRLGKKRYRRGPASSDESRILYECVSGVCAKFDRIPDSLDSVTKELRGLLRFRTINNFVSSN